MVDLSWILGRARVSFTNCATPVTIATKSGQSIPLPDLVKDVTPPCHLNPLLFNGHLQTAYTVVKGVDIPVVYKRKIFTSNNPAVPGSFAVDFVHRITSDEVDPTLPPRTTYFTEQQFGEIGSDDSKPMLVTLHGLAGGSNEIYLRHVLAPMTTEEGGWEACVVNSRGCAMSKITSNVLYNARATWDVRQVVSWLREKFPNRPLFGIGFSLGANIITNYIGEEGENWRHAEAIAKNPNIDEEEVKRCIYLYEFDRAVQCGSWGYPTENAYYRDASSCDSMLAIKIPFLAINAEDDPISVKEAIPFDEFKQNPYAVLCSTSLGGHLSWFQSNGDRWFAKAAVAFLKKMADDADFDATEKANTRNANGVAERRDRAFVFEPMRRKLHIPKDHAE
ncbi:AB-hydrolase YheT putative [Macrophomina phaseolina MS6]|uniref:AB-hydrolase YheT putative n=1 Tax=Macrophomina phaseolina (strain MS6) TaxID=1126212 RepID=K2S803_MACPH|nr:AB-hydrolase YheT putative [Macrophomina phaseolina MS6]